MTRAPLTSEQRHIRIQNYIERMPSLPATVSKVMDVCNRPDTSPNDLSRVISLDPVLTGQVLKLINSAYYSLPNQITTLSRAIIMLGLNTVKNLALSTSVLGSIGGEELFQHLPMDLFWTHSLGVGVIAKNLAAKKGVSPLLREEYFVAGLLHDLGKIPLSRCFPDEYDKVFELAKGEESPLNKIEARLLKLDHGQAGEMIADKWQLSPALNETIHYHHNPSEAGEDNRGLAAIVALANIYANDHEIGSAGDHYHDDSLAGWFLELLDLSEHDFADLDETVSEEIEKAQVFLQVAKEG